MEKLLMTQHAQRVAATSGDDVADLIASNTQRRPSKGGRPRNEEITTRTDSGRPNYAGRTATTYFPDAEAKERFIVAARRWGTPEGMDSLTDLLLKSAERTVREWERKYNDGEPATDFTRGLVTE